MNSKHYKLRSRTLQGGTAALRDLDMEFDGERAFILWDSISFGNYQLKARVEIDPGQLEKANLPVCDYLYRGELVLPCPQDN